jgi:small-conductance mechanosensitive channel
MRGHAAKGRARPDVLILCALGRVWLGFWILLFLGGVLVCANVRGALATSGPLKAVLGGSSNEPAATNVASAAEQAEAALRKVEARLAEARQNLAAASSAGASAVPAGISTQQIWTRRARLQRLVRVYEQQLSAAEELQAARDRKAVAVREAQTWARFAEPPPYSIHLTDRLREEIQTERLKQAKGDSASGSLNQLTDELRKSLTHAEENIRQLNERQEKAKDPAVSAQLAWQRDFEQLQSQLAAAGIATLETERSVQREELAASGSRLELLRRQLVIADAGVKFTQADLDQATAQLDRERELLEKDLDQALTRRNASLGSLREARDELDSARKGPDAVSVTVSRLEETVALGEAQLETADAVVRGLRLMLESGNSERTMWELRFASWQSRSTDALADSERRLQSFARRLSLWRVHEAQQLEVAAHEVELQETRLGSLDPGSDVYIIASNRLATLRQRDQMALRVVRNLERVERLTQRWGEGLQEAESNLPLTGRVENLFSGAHSFLQGFWNFEVFSAEDTITVDGQKITGKRSVTISKIVLALLILAVGYWLTGLITRMLEPVFVRRLRVEPNQAVLIRRWLRAFLIVCLVLFSMRSVRIPFTVFAFAGGALAIGLGFGMQTLLKNFVSGLIILFERPFRVGDVLDVGGQQGTMTNVGLRASVLQLWDGTETLIPNSSLLENNLTNWTYSDRKVRFSVAVGVAYGSDPRRVIQLMSEVAERHGLVEKEPKPLVLFTQFGESTLNFELRFWVDVSKANSGQVASDLRLMIASSFEEHRIVIAFPQRDLHVHSARPIAVEVVSGAGVPFTASK